jgi:hypothetical protein
VNAFVDSVLRAVREYGVRRWSGRIGVGLETGGPYNKAEDCKGRL